MSICSVRMRLCLTSHENPRQGQQGAKRYNLCVRVCDYVHVCYLCVYAVYMYKYMFLLVRMRPYATSQKKKKKKKKKKGKMRKK